jgi:hypothetical protein
LWYLLPLSAGSFFNVKFWDIFVAFLLATLPFIFRCSRRPHFCALGHCLACADPATLPFLCPHLWRQYCSGSVLFAILLLLMIGGLLCCFKEKLSNVLFYFSSGFATWYISDRLFLVIASICRLNSSLVPYFTERTPSHILLYITCFLEVYLFIYFTVGKKMHALGDSEIPMQNALLFLLLDCMLTPIFYFESGAISQYNIFFYNLLNIGEIIFYIFMLLLQVQMLAAAKDRVEISTMKKLWVEEQKQYQLVKENIDAINIKCHDLKHQIRNLRTTGQVDPAYLDDLERSVSIYNSAVRTGNETLDIVLTDKRLHCASHNIQFTCIADGSGVAFMETMDIFSLFGNILDNAIECESLQPPEMRFIHLSVRTVNRMLTIHAENHFEDSLQFKDGLPVTTKEDKDSHGYGIMSVRHIVEKYNGSFSISTQDKLFQIDIILPIPCDDTGRSAG